jgi:DNA-binding response OmpR family regulator
MLGRKKRIIIIDDEELICKVLSLRLSNEGYIVDTALDGKEGLDKITKSLYDLAIIDVGLPKIDGNTLCELIKNNSKLKDMKVIILTGKNLVGDVEKAYESGADAYFSKPYDYNLLLNKIKKLIG